MKKAIIFIILFNLVVVAFSQALKPVLAVLPFEGVTKEEGDRLAVQFSRNELNEVFRLTSRTSALESIFREWETQSSEYINPNTIVRQDQMLNAGYVFTGNIYRLGDRNILITTIVNVETLELVGGYYFPYNTIQDINNSISTILRGLLNSTNDYFRRSLVLPGLGIDIINDRTRTRTFDAETLSVILAIEMLNNGKYAILPPRRSKIVNAAFLEQDFQTRGYTEEQKMIALGRAMGASFVLGGYLEDLRTDNKLTAYIQGTESAVYISNTSKEFRTVNEVFEMMKEIAKDLINPQRHALGNSFREQIQWFLQNMESDTRYIIEINNNATIRMDDHLTLRSNRKNVEITIRGIGNDRMLRSQTPGELFNIGSGITLILDNITLHGRNDNTRPLIIVNSGSTFIMNNDSKIIENGTSGVQVNTGGTFNMNVGSIYGIKGNGVIVQRNSTFNMNGGHIYGNTGYGIHNSGTFRISNGMIFGNDDDIEVNKQNSRGSLFIGSPNALMDRGRFNPNGTFTQLGTLSATSTLIWVINGFIQ